MDNPISTVLQQTPHDWTTKGSRHTITDQLASLNKETAMSVATQLLGNENIIPAKTVIQTITSEKQQISKRREMDEKLAAIRRRLIGDHTLWNGTVATTQPVMTTAEEHEPGKDQAVKDLLQALKTHGEDEELPAEISEKQQCNEDDETETSSTIEKSKIITELLDEWNDL